MVKIKTVGVLGVSYLHLTPFLKPIPDVRDDVD